MAVAIAVEETGASKTFACRVIGISPNSLVIAPRELRDAVLRRWLRYFAHRHPRWGWRKAYWHLRNNQRVINNKKVKRLWREEGLCRKRKAKRQRCQKPQTNVYATAPNDVWALDFQFDQTTDGRNLKCLNVIDECTRESLAGIASRIITHEDVIAVLGQLIIERGAPTYLRCDNGKEFIAKDLVAWLELRGVTHSPIKPASPWQNGKCESYNGIMRDELLNMELFHSLEHAQYALDQWRALYNHYRPHGSLKGMTPAAYAASAKEQHQLTKSLIMH